LGKFGITRPNARLVTLGIQGFDYEKARRDLSIPAAFDVLAMVVGKPAPKELPIDVQQRTGGIFNSA
jgi:hypothetical protein